MYERETAGEWDSPARRAVFSGPVVAARPIMILGYRIARRRGGAQTPAMTGSDIPPALKARILTHEIAVLSNVRLVSDAGTTAIAYEEPFPWTAIPSAVAGMVHVNVKFAGVPVAATFVGGDGRDGAAKKSLSK